MYLLGGCVRGCFRRTGCTSLSLARTDTGRVKLALGLSRWQKAGRYCVLSVFTFLFLFVSKQETYFLPSASGKFNKQAVSSES